MLRLFSLFGLLLLISHWSACIYFVLNLRVSPTWAVDLLAMDNSVDNSGGDSSIYVLSLYYSFLVRMLLRLSLRIIVTDAVSVAL